MRNSTSLFNVWVGRLGLFVYLFNYLLRRNKPNQTSKRLWHWGNISILQEKNPKSRKHSPDPSVHSPAHAPPPPRPSQSYVFISVLCYSLHCKWMMNQSWDVKLFNTDGFPQGLRRTRCMEPFHQSFSFFFLSSFVFYISKRGGCLRERCGSVFQWSSKFFLFFFLVDEQKVIFIHMKLNQLRLDFYFGWTFPLIISY